MERLTPIEEHDGWLWKRDDYFTIDGLAEVNGTKLRFLRDALKKWQFTDYDTIAVVAQPRSHSLFTLRQLAELYKKRLVIAGDACEFQELANEENVLPIWQARDNNDHYSYYSIADQCMNIPDVVENIIVPCGSGHTLYGIMRGLMDRSSEFRKRFRVYGIGNKPLARMAIGQALMQMALASGIELVYLNRRRDRPDYSERMDVQGMSPIPLDTHHELNAYLYAKEMLADLLYGRRKTLFWVVGNYNFLRRNHADTSHDDADI